MAPLKRGAWLGIDVGSRRQKVGSFCLIESDGSGSCTVSFEKGPAREPYPTANTWQSLIGRREPPWPPTYLKKEVDEEIGRILDRSELVGRWFRRTKDRPSAVAVDAPVAFALEGRRRLTEARSTDTIETPIRAVFEAQLATKEDPFLRINSFWKCVAFSVYRHLACRIDPVLGGASLESLAALTCDRRKKRRRLRETFPSDVYKRANGVAGVLSDEAREVLKRLVAVEWQAAGSEPGHRPVSQTMQRLEAIRGLLSRELKAGDDALREMRRRPGRTGDLWDAFACAFAACCEDHGGAELHGGSEADERRRLLSEGAILTVKRRA